MTGTARGKEEEEEDVISQLSLSNVSGLRHLVNTPITTSSDADSHRVPGVSFHQADIHLATMLQ